MEGSRPLSIPCLVGGSSEPRIMDIQNWKEGLDVEIREANGHPTGLLPVLLTCS
jgi:hypothetical protein